MGSWWPGWSVRGKRLCQWGRVGNREGDSLQRGAGGELAPRRWGIPWQWGLLGRRQPGEGRDAGPAWLSPPRAARAAGGCCRCWGVGDAEGAKGVGAAWGARPGGGAGSVWGCWGAPATGSAQVTCRQGLLLPGPWVQGGCTCQRGRSDGWRSPPLLASGASPDCRVGVSPYLGGRGFVGAQKSEGSRTAWGPRVRTVGAAVVAAPWSARSVGV